MMIEEWKAVPDFEGLYEVSSCGRVRGLKRGKILIPTPDQRGRVCVFLCRNCKKYTFRISVLVARAFIGPKPEKMGVCHNDGNHSNNHVSNLRYGTQKDNMDDRERHGNTSRGVGHPTAKLNPDKVRKIRELRGVKNTRELAEMFGVRKQSIDAIYNGISWRHVT